jgi:hypothetical protein
MALANSAALAFRMWIACPFLRVGSAGSIPCPATTLRGDLAHVLKSMCEGSDGWSGAIKADECSHTWEVWDAQGKAP